MIILKSHFLQQQMDSLLANITKRHLIPDNLDQPHLTHTNHLPSPHSQLNVHISKTSSFCRSYHTTPFLFDRTISQSTLTSQRIQIVNSLCVSPSDGFQQKFMKYDNHQKTKCLLDVIRMYRKLVAEHGLFFFSLDHLKIDFDGLTVGLMSQDISKIQSSLFLNPTKYNQWRVVQSFLDLFRKYYSVLFFKYAKIRTLQDLQNFFSKVKKRNEIHKRCKIIVRQMSRSKVKASISARSISPDASKVKTSISARSISPDASASKQFDLSHRPLSYFGAINPKSNLSISITSKYYLSPSDNKREHKESLSRGGKSELDTTTNISCSVMRQNKSYLQTQRFGYRTHDKRKSCLVKPAQNEVSLWNYANKTSMLINVKQCKPEQNHLDEKQGQKDAGPVVTNKEHGEGKNMKSSLQVCFQSLFLSEIIEDKQSEMLSVQGTVDKMDQFMKDFEHVFY